MHKLKFYDLKRRKSFTTDKYRLTSKRTKSGMRYFAVTKAPSKTESWRIVSKDFYQKNK
ncbi:hypothetical protein LCGC14_1803470 [marine sediment metagenome]|uniref:Uncharacterized protein n=1 Tax=marine sediment metagenome TaxID=412755 RepID=A0A0F9JNK4_9ZZZZ